MDAADAERKGATEPADGAARVEGLLGRDGDLTASEALERVDGRAAELAEAKKWPDEAQLEEATEETWEAVWAAACPEEMDEADRDEALELLRLRTLLRARVEAGRDGEQAHAGKKSLWFRKVFLRREYEPAMVRQTGSREQVVATALAAAGISYLLEDPAAVNVQDYHGDDRVAQAQWEIRSRAMDCVEDLKTELEKRRLHVEWEVVGVAANPKLATGGLPPGVVSPLGVAPTVVLVNKGHGGKGPFTVFVATRGTASFDDVDTDISFEEARWPHGDNEEATVHKGFLLACEALFDESRQPVAAAQGGDNDEAEAEAEMLRSLPQLLAAAQKAARKAAQKAAQQAAVLEAAAQEAAAQEAAAQEAAEQEDAAQAAQVDAAQGDAAQGDAAQGDAAQDDAARDDAAQEVHGDDVPVAFTGHSLGGAVAQLVALRMRREEQGAERPRRPLVISFSSPRVGNISFVEGASRGMEHLRVYHRGDRVPSVPSAGETPGGRGRNFLQHAGGADAHRRVRGFGRRSKVDATMPPGGSVERSWALNLARAAKGAAMYHPLTCIAAAFVPPHGTTRPAYWPFDDDGAGCEAVRRAWGRPPAAP